MFSKTYGNVIIKESSTPKRGHCLCASMVNEAFEPIYMDYYGFAVPEGINFYMYGNKMIVISRFSEIKPFELDRMMNGYIELSIIPCNYFQVGLRFGNKYASLYGWDTCMGTLYHCMSGMNDTTKPVDEIIFIFCDKEEGEIVGERSVKTNEGLGNILSACNMKTAEELSFFRNIKSFLKVEETKDETRDWLDMLYDRLFEFTCEYYKTTLTLDIENLGGSFRVVIDEDNDIESLYRVGG